MNGSLVCVDPGLRACGVSLFVDGQLVRAGAVRGHATLRGPAAWRILAQGVEAWVGDAVPGVLLVEEMKVYVASKGDPSDLIELSGVAGAVVGRLSAWQAEGVKARDWNGQVPSEIRRARTRKWVEEAGWLSCVDLDTTARFQQDIWSALGIARWKLSGVR